MIVNSHPCLTSNNRANNLCPMKYGERLKAARNHAKLTQARLAELSEIAQPTISELETTGENGSIHTTRFARICGVSADWLAEEIGEMIPNFYQTCDPKIIAVARVMEPMPEYVKDAAVQDVSKIAELVARTRDDGDGTHG